MNGLLTVSVFLGAAIALSSACCTPNQWEGGEGSIVGYASSRMKGVIKEYVGVSYDFLNRRSAALLNYRNGEIKAKYRIVVIYGHDENNGHVYIVDLNKDKCWKRSLRRPFRQACIPKRAKHFADFYIGLKNGLEASSYEIESKKFYSTFSVNMVGNGTCIPLGETHVGKIGRYATMRTLGFINITAGIKDTSVFDVPSECEENDEIHEELTRDHYIFAL